jgi:hypothetical protein
LEKNEIEIRQLSVEMEHTARKLGLQINQKKTKYMIVERKNSLKQNRNISKKLKLKLKNTVIDQTFTYASETWILAKRDRKHMNIFERKV